MAKDKGIGKPRQEKKITAHRGGVDVRLYVPVTQNNQDPFILPPLRFLGPSRDGFLVVVGRPMSTIELKR